MNDADFFKSFSFNLFQYKQYRTTDMTSGCPMHYLAQMVSGSAKIVTEEKTLQIKKGDVFFIPKNLSYRSYWYPENDNTSFYSFGFNYFPTKNTGYKLQKIDLTPSERGLLIALEADITRCAKTIGLLYQLLGSFEPRILTEEHHTCTTINKALEFMRQNTGYTIKQVADACSVSESGLYITFKRHLNKTPVDVRQELMCSKAKELLFSTDLSIEEISDSLGFSSSSYFRKIFHSKVHKTPTAYRKESRNI